MSQSAWIFLAAYEVKWQGNVFRRVEHELEKRFHAAFLNKMREERWYISFPLPAEVRIQHNLMQFLLKSETCF